MPSWIELADSHIAVTVIANKNALFGFFIAA
jgi:hypothetical protein